MHELRKKRIKTKMNVWRYLVLGYFLVVAAGCILLLFPFSSTEGATPFIDALFTSASAACVTGLTPYEAGVHWSTFGQVVILLLIQIGGLGFMTFVSVLFLMIGRGFGLYERRVVQQTVGGTLSSVKQLIRRIFIGTLVFEGLGTGLLSLRFIPDFGPIGVWYALFHSVSAFCNAGFDVLGGTFAGVGSFSHYATDPLVVLTLTALIVLGGLGFCVWGDVLDCRLNPKKFQFYTKVILIVNSVLIVGGTLLFLLFERNNPSYAGYNFGEKLLCALFNSVTARTAGFYTTDPNTLSGSGYLLMVVLMFIGGSSGSTAGGIKVGTFTVIVMGMLSALRSRTDINVGKRRIDMRLLWQALAIFTAYLTLVLFSTLIICTVEPEAEGLFAKTLFETVSAVGTVGLSMSFTATLHWASKLVIILLMFAGRVGVLTLAYAFRRKTNTPEVRRPIDAFYIG